MTRSRIRNLALPLGLAALAAVLIGMYVISYRNRRDARRRPGDGPGCDARHPGRHRRLDHRGWGRVKSQTVPRRAVMPGVRSPPAAPLTAKVTAGQIYEGQQVTLRQFVPVAQGGVFAKFSGAQRLVDHSGRSEPDARRNHV